MSVPGTGGNDKSTLEWEDRHRNQPSRSSVTHAMKESVNRATEAQTVPCSLVSSSTPPHLKSPWAIKPITTNYNCIHYVCKRVKKKKKQCREYPDSWLTWVYGVIVAELWSLALSTQNSHRQKPFRTLGPTYYGGREYS